MLSYSKYVSLNVHLKSFMMLLSLPLGPRICQVEYDYNIAGHNVVSKDNVPTWKSCAEECSKNDNCYAWTWVSAQNTDTRARLKCFLKDDSWMQGRRVKKNHVSGDKTCGQSELRYRNSR